jgi:hypothetical protein
MTGGARVSAERERGASVPFRERHRVGRGPDPGLGQIRSRGLLLFFVVFLFPFSIFLFSFVTFANQLQTKTQFFLKFNAAS